MQRTSPLSNAVNRLWQPRLSLSACVRGVMGRNTLGVELSEAQRFNYFPATPLCSLSWWFEGSSELLTAGVPVSQSSLDSPRDRLPEGCLFGGPRTQPTVSWNPGPVHSITLLLMPDALHQLTGIDPRPWCSGLVAASQVLPPTWLAMCDAVQAASDDDTRVQLMQDFLDPLWQAARPHQAPGIQRYHDWADGLALRAATSGLGRSLRQVERRIKQWSGQPLRELRGLGRAEQAFYEAMAAQERGELSWTDVAADSGYADQSHLCRETRRVTGFTPEALRQRMAEDEGFWSYRLWGGVDIL
ncbi:MAG: araC family transcriptional regulator [Comamonadaceae bacterium]|nr:MAG: araC family transcriptional regulator [Comamonadaceae bacterium]